MPCSSLLEAAVHSGAIKNALFIGSSEKELIVDLQRVLHELGFSKELKWSIFQADGDYGNATAAAVAAFAQKNGKSSNGNSVTITLAKLILQRHDFLPSMYILWRIHKSDLRTKYYVSKGTKMSIIAVQTLLNELGYGRQLKYSKFGADGFYGSATRSAVKAFANDNNISSDGDLLTRPLVNLFLEKIIPYYGKNWSDFAEKRLEDDASPLAYFEGDRFIGKPCEADVLFLPALKRINQYAEDANVYIHVTSSFRTTTNVQGAIVKPATYSNHLIGHGIDMNIKYDNKPLVTSKVLVKYPNVPAPVKQFLKAIIDDPKLRWGGQFSTKDPVHIDDGYNQNRTKWNTRYEIIQKAAQLGT